MRTLKLTLLCALIAIATLFLLAPTGAQAQDPDFLVSLDDPMAPFLESRAYAARMGATAEFRKMEWVALDEASNKLYLAMSEINKTMSDGEGDINVTENFCGIVYEADLDADYNISSLKPLLVGGPYDPDAGENQCALDNISNPDNLFVDNQGNLWIGEDTSAHVNNFMWRWDGEKLQRFAAMPRGAETTGIYVTDAGDIFISVQHPSGMSTYPFNRAAVIAVTGFKAGDSFTDLPVPEGDAQNTVTLAAGDYQVLARVGEEIPHDPYSQRWGQINRADGRLDQMCNQPDGNIFVPTNANSSEGYLYTNYECQPGTVGKLYIRHNGESWDILEGENVDFSMVGGTWNNCGSSLTPWLSVLTSEEYEPIATRADWQKNIEHVNDNVMSGQANPYDYGWLVELYPDTDGDLITTQVIKQYALGRFSHENALVMPDQKTIYHGDDGTGVVFFKSVADEAGDLSSATLYAARVTQNADESFELTWIELGNSNNDDIYDAIQAVTLQ